MNNTGIIKRVLIILVMFLVAGILSYILVTVDNNKIMNQYNKLINWAELEVDEQELNKEVTPIEGTITLSNYISLRRQDSIDGLAKIEGILPKKVIKNIKDGIESQYYLDSVTAEYYSLCEGIRDLIKQCEYINKLYTAYQTDIGIDDINYCVEYGQGSKDRCELYDYFSMYSTRELKQYFFETHNKWESLVNYMAQKEQLEDGYIDLYYQDEICTNLGYIKSLDVEVLVLNSDMYNSGLEDIQAAKDKGYLMVDRYNETSIEYLSQLNLYRDINFYDGEMKKLASKTISSLFTAEAIDEGSVTSLGNDLTQEELEEELLNIKASASDAEEIHLELDDYQVLEYSLTGKDERDVYYVLYKVKDAEHDIDLIPSKEDMMYELTLKGKAMMAQQQVAQIVMAEVNDIDVTETGESEDGTHTHTNGLDNIINEAD